MSSIFIDLDLQNIHIFVTEIFNELDIEDSKQLLENNEKVYNILCRRLDKNNLFTLYRNSQLVICFMMYFLPVSDTDILDADWCSAKIKQLGKECFKNIKDQYIFDDNLIFYENVMKKLENFFI